MSGEPLVEFDVDNILGISNWASIYLPPLLNTQIAVTDITDIPFDELFNFISNQGFYQLPAVFNYTGEMYHHLDILFLPDFISEFKIDLNGNPKVPNGGLKITDFIGYRVADGDTMRLIDVDENILKTKRSKIMFIF